MLVYQRVLFHRQILVVTFLVVALFQVKNYINYPDYVEYTQNEEERIMNILALGLNMHELFMSGWFKKIPFLVIATQVSIREHQTIWWIFQLNIAQHGIASHLLEMGSVHSPPSKTSG
jgi:predicted restriction endonuclease